MAFAFYKSGGHPIRRGFSIIELLIAIIIIGVLVTVLIPVIANRSEDARKARAGQDIESLCDAEERLSVDINYYSRLFFLNDVVGGDGVTFDPNNPTLDIVDGVRDYPVATRLFLDPTTQVYVPLLVGQNLLIDLQTNETTFGWHGPYINWHRDTNYVRTGGAKGPDGIPDDPWGNNYLLFTRAGLVVETGDITAAEIRETSAFPFASPDGSGEYDCKRFDRPAILSLGPNGLPGDGSGAGSSTGQFGMADDIVRKFGQ